jgi:hypothetical protein
MKPRTACCNARYRLCPASYGRVAHIADRRAIDARSRQRRSRPTLLLEVPESADTGGDLGGALEAGYSVREVINEAGLLKLRSDPRSQPPLGSPAR